MNHIDPTHIPLGLKLNFITQPMYLWGICFVKISIGFFLLRIASTKFYSRLISGIMSEWRMNNGYELGLSRNLLVCEL